MIPVYMQRIVWQSNCKMQQEKKNEAILNHIYYLILLWKDLFCIIFLFLFTLDWSADIPYSYWSRFERVGNYHFWCQKKNAACNLR